MRNGLMMVYVVLAVLFASVLHPLTILFSLPLSITGAILGVDHDQLGPDPARGDRHPDAHGHRHQERHHADRFCDRGHAQRRRAHRGDHGRVSKARSADHHDHDRDGCRHGCRAHWRSAPAASSARRWRSPSSAGSSSRPCFPCCSCRPSSPSWTISAGSAGDCSGASSARPMSRRPPRWRSRRSMPCLSEARPRRPFARKEDRQMRPRPAKVG